MAEHRDSSGADPFDAGPFRRIQEVLRLQPPGIERPIAVRSAVATGLAWVPLLLLAAMEGLALGPEPRESFLLDISAHVRYLVAIPLLIAAEAWCLPRLASIVRHFATSGLIAAEDAARLDGFVASARRRLDHGGVEATLVLTAYAASVLTSRVLYPEGVPSWVSPEGTQGLSGLSVAGWWRMLVSHPLFLILLFGWLWRFIVWFSFLWSVSRLRLELVPAHPDLAGGLRFLAAAAGAFAPFDFAVGAVVAGTLGEEAVVAGDPLEMRYLLALAIALGVALLVFAGPLFLFAGPMRRARLRGIGEYGAVATRVGRHFEDRWLRGVRPITPKALDAPDFSATADLFVIVANVRRMSVVPFGLSDLAFLVAATALPFLPIVLLIVPLGEILTRMAELLL